MSGDKITQEYLQSRLSYEPESGAFTWLPVPGHSRAINSWNGKNAGKRAGFLNPTGRGKIYISIEFNGDRYLAHRLVWLYVHGGWPPHEIDHINGDAMDNRLCNLRSATHAENSQNSRIQKNNSSGLKGAAWDVRKSKWMSNIVVHRKRHFLGYHKTAEAAHAAYCEAANRLHGEFARTE